MIVSLKNAIMLLWLVVSISGQPVSQPVSQLDRISIQHEILIEGKVSKRQSPQQRPEIILNNIVLNIDDFNFHKPPNKSPDINIFELYRLQPKTILIQRDAKCFIESNLLGYVLEGDQVKHISESELEIVIEHPRIMESCTINRNALDPLPLIPDWLIAEVLKWRLYVYEAAEYTKLDPLVIFAVIGKESHGKQFDVSTDGFYSVGLMQVIPGPLGCRNWDLTWPRFNIVCGSMILKETIGYAQEDIDNGYIAPNGYSPTNAVRAGLGAYNCSFASLYSTNDKVCYAGGGLDYADDILNVWIPAIEAYAEKNRIFLASLNTLIRTRSAE